MAIKVGDKVPAGSFGIMPYDKMILPPCCEAASSATLKDRPTSGLTRSSGNKLAVTAAMDMRSVSPCIVTVASRFDHAPRPSIVVGLSRQATYAAFVTIHGMRLVAP